MTTWKNATLAIGSISTEDTSTFRRRIVIVARPAARRLRSQLTSPNGAISQRLPALSTTVTGVVRGTPVVRPRIVISTFGPIGTPAFNRSRATGLNSGIQAGTRVDLSGLGNGHLPSLPWSLSKSQPTF